MSELSISGFPDGGALSSNPISPVGESPSLSPLYVALMKGSRAANFARQILKICETLPTDIELFDEKQHFLLFKLATKCRAVKEVRTVLENNSPRLLSEYTTIKEAFDYSHKVESLQAKIDNLCSELPSNKEEFVLPQIRNILSLARSCNRTTSVFTFLGLKNKDNRLARSSQKRKLKGILNKEQILKHKRIVRQEWKRRKKLTDPRFKIERALRKRIKNAIKRNKKSGKTLELLGCTSAFLKTHLESQWKPGMSWDNYGTFGWHIDHIRPCASFNLSDPLEQAKCFHYKNLQPLWAKENIAKGAKYDPNQA